MSDNNFKSGFERLNYHYGMLLTAEDMELEQNYFISKRKLFNQYMFGCRIIFGFEVELYRNEVLVQNGLCLDCCGHEIYLPNEVRVPLPENDHNNFLVVMYKEIRGRPLTPLGGDSLMDCDKINVQNSRIIEGCEIMWQTVCPLANHDFQDDAWKACGNQHPIPIAKIYKKQRTLRLVNYKEFNKGQKG
jgi:hypothetical protein